MKIIKGSVLCAALLTITMPAAEAQTYPSQPIRLIVPAAAGGSTDIGARLIARLMGQELNGSVFVENRGGGGGRVGATDAARAQPDGYTLIYANSITHALLPAVAKSLSYDPIKDFVPIGGMFWYSTLIVCNPKTPFKDLAGLIQYAKEKPGKLTVATAGPGSGNHFSSELLSSMAGISVTHVHYKGNSPATLDVVSGFVDCIHIGEAKPFLDAGDLKAIATTGQKRDPRFPDVPTVEEAGLEGYDVTWWQGVFAPVGTPPEIVAKLASAAQNALADPSVKPTMWDVGFVPQYVPPADLIQRMRRDADKFHAIAVAAKLDIN